MNGVIRSWRMEQNSQQIDFVFPSSISRLFSYFAIGPFNYCIKTIIRTKTDLIVIKFYMSKDSFKYYYCLYIIRFCTVFSGKLATMATGHAMPYLHLFEYCKSLKACIAWPVAMARFTTDSVITIYTKARSYQHWMYSYTLPMPRK
jgi:hypothetical protein